jgi:hypothetical protein
VVEIEALATDQFGNADIQEVTARPDGPLRYASRSALSSSEAFRASSGGASRSAAAVTLSLNAKLRFGWDRIDQLAFT